MTFKKGQSGNPKGRKPGVPTRTTTALREAFLNVYRKLGAEKHLAAWAQEDPAGFYRIMGSKLIPNGAPIRISLSGTPAEQAQQVTSALADGRLTPEEASSVMGVIQRQIRIMEADELEKRVAAIEEHVNDKTRRAHRKT